MSVKSTPLPSTQKSSAIVRRQQVDSARRHVERIAALVILVIDAIGTIVVCHGGWVSILKFQFSIAAILGGVLLFGVLTWLQCAYYHRKIISWPARAANATLTALGYGPLFVGGMALWFTARGVDAVILGIAAAVAVSWVIIWLLSLAVAWFPESRLVD